MSHFPNNVDLTLRSEVGSPLTANQHDTNLQAIQDRLNEISTLLDKVHQYGEAYLAANTVLNVAANNTEYQLVNFTQGQADGINFANNNLQLPANGNYLLQAAISFEGLNNTEFKFAFAVGGNIVGDHAIWRKTSSNDVGALSLAGLIAGVAGQNVGLSVYALAGGNTGNITLRAGTTFFIRRVE